MEKVLVSRSSHAPEPEQQQGNRFRIPSDEIALGMFVAELDRPWLDTPFLIQGFLVDRDDEIEALRKYSRHVYIDLNLSHPELADVIRKSAAGDLEQAGDTPRAPAQESQPLQFARKAEPAPARTDADIRAPGPELVPKSKPALAAAAVDVKPMRALDRQERRYKDRALREMLRVDYSPVESSSLLELIRAWLQSLITPRPSKQAQAKARRANREEIKKILPQDVALKRYAEPRPIAQVLPRAEKSFNRARKTLETLSLDLRNDRIPQLDQIKDAVTDMVNTMVQNPDALMWVAKLREEDGQVYEHGVKVAIYLMALGRHLGFPKEDLAHLGTIGLLADVGKTKVARAILEKPGMLDADEFSEVKLHVEIGLQLLQSSMTLPKAVVDGIAQHHERLDGTGYPNGLSGDQIGIYGRMAAIADSFAALVSTRPYANASSAQDALMNLYEWCGTSFHEPLVEQFVQAIGIFPVGSMVELSSGEVAIVLSHNRTRRLEPKVLVISWPDHRPLSTPVERDLKDKPTTPDGKPLRIVRGLASGAYGLQVRNYYGNELANANGLV